MFHGCDRSTTFIRSSRPAILPRAFDLREDHCYKPAQREDAMDLGLKGKVVLITGGSKGIGKAVARGLLEEGARVSICARSKGDLDATAAELMKKPGGEVFTVAGGLTKPGS